ncbi:MAG: diguanylate cyclase [Thermoguttaceae bacterium]
MNPAETAPLNVLVVDDDPATLRLIATIVSSAGHRVSRAANGREAFDCIQHDPPDLVLCDWDMPELDGVELCRKVREHWLAHYIYFLLLTGKSSVDEMVQGLAAGADDFVTKPINPAVLLARLEAGSRVVRMERQLRTISQRDPLTGLLNRRTFYERFVQEWDRAGRYGHPLACALVDLDFFKRINDTHGHAAGDAALKTVAAHLQTETRPSDMLCRYGGEEFCILLTETDETGAASWAERVRAAISEVAIPAGSLSLRVTASIGVAQRLVDTATPEQLVDLADQALALAKKSGRNRVVRAASISEPALDLSDMGPAGPLDGVLARDVMSVAILCPRRDDSVRQVTEMFLQLRLTSAPVIDEAGIVRGIVTQADLLTQTAQGKGWDDTVGKVMRTDVVCYEEDTPILEVYEFLSRVSVPRVVVVRDDRPTGVISRATLLRWFRNWLTAHEQSGPGSREGCPADELRRRKAGIIRLAQAVEQRAVELRERTVREDGDDFAALVVAEVTRLQSLVNDLLGHCRGANVP